MRFFGIGGTEDDGVELDAVAHGDHDILAGVGAEVVGLGLRGDFIEEVVFGAGEVEAGDVAGWVGKEDVVRGEIGLETGDGFRGEVDAGGARAFDIEAVAVAEDGEDVVGLLLVAILANVGIESGGGDVDGRR